MASEFPKTKKVGILVFNDFEPLDVWGPVEAFAIARFIHTDYSTPAPRPFEIELISNETRTPGSGPTPPPVRSYNGPSVAPLRWRDEALESDETYDILLIPGGLGVSEILANEAERVALREWVRAMNRETKVRLMTSVCTGAAILADSGALDGRAAATNHQAFSTVTSYGPLVHWDNVSRWVHDGRYVSSAGVSAGTDMAFYPVYKLCGRAVAEAAALAAEYDWHRDPQTPIHYPAQATVPGS